MDGDLERYLKVIVILLSLNIGFKATALWISPAAYNTDLVIPPVVAAVLVCGFTWVLTGVLDR
jgi:hypothetical protein